MADDGPLQLSLFDEQDLAEITSDDFPGERLIACRNPVLACERARKREDLLAATEKLLAPLIALVAAGRLHGAAEIGRKAGEVLNKYKMAKHLDVTITDTSLDVQRKQDQIDDEARLDGIYVIRTRSRSRARCRRNRHGLQEPQVRGTRLPPHQIRRPRPRPGFHRLDKRVRGHVLICMLAAYLTWHLRQAWAPLDVHRRGPARTGGPRRPRGMLGTRRGQGPPAARRARPPLPQLPGPAGPPGYPDPQRAPLHRHARCGPRPDRPHRRGKKKHSASSDPTSR